MTSSGYWPSAGTDVAQYDSLVGRSQSTYWNSGGSAPQWVQLQLPGAYTISTICLWVAQLPNGNTIHQISVGPTAGSLSVVTTLNGYTYSGQWINITYNPWLSNVRFIRVDSLSSPSWIAWQKCLVYGV